MKMLQLRGGRQIAEKEQITAFRKAEAPLLYEIFAKLRQAVSAVGKLTFYGHAFPLAQYITVRVADFCHPRRDSGTVRLAQSALDLVALECGRRNPVSLLGFVQ